MNHGQRYNSHFEILLTGLVKHSFTAIIVSQVVVDKLLGRLVQLPLASISMTEIKFAKFNLHSFVEDKLRF